jgi:hypothetical protein
MSMLAFMPWCRLDRAYDLGRVQIEPLERDSPIEGLSEEDQRRVEAILTSYKTVEGVPIDRAALVRYHGKSPIADLTDSEVEEAFELVALANFCGIANREYLSALGPYCNSDCFSLYAQKFDKADFTTLTARRRDGRAQSLWRVDKIIITAPVHCHTIRQVRLDDALLQSLVAHRSQLRPCDWARWQNAITCFNHANTDSVVVQHQVEWVLLCSAFEHLTRARSNAKDVARKFSDAVKPSSELLASQATRRSCVWTDAKASLRYEWMREFYRIRGDFAHGRLNTQKSAVWNPLEHLVLATIAFPLLVKSKLQQEGRYQPTISDQAQIDSFEALADTSDLLKPPCDHQNSVDSHWTRLRRQRESHLSLERAYEEALRKVKPPEEGSAACGSPDSK